MNIGKWIVSILAGAAAVCTIATFVLAKPCIPSKELKFKLYVDKVISMQTLSDSVSVFYGDKPVSNVWKVTLDITNTGKNPIIGQGSESDTNGNPVEVDFAPFVVVDYNVISNEPQGDIICDGSKLFICFQKWNPKEKGRLEALLSRPDNFSDAPGIMITDRNLPNVSIKREEVDIYQVIQETDSFEWIYRVKQFFPKWVLKMSKYIALFMCLLFCFMPFIGIGQGIMERKKMKKWKSQYYEDYCTAIRGLGLEVETENVLLEHPEKLSDQISQQIRIPRPPQDNGIVLDLFVAVFFFFVATLPSVICGLILYFHF